MKCQQAGMKPATTLTSTSLRTGLTPSPGGESTRVVAGPFKVAWLGVRDLELVGAGLVPAHERTASNRMLCEQSALSFGSLSGATILGETDEAHDEAGGGRGVGYEAQE